MAAHPKVFDELAVSMVRAGQEGGFLEDVLKRVAIFVEGQEDLKAKVVGAVAYPVILAVVGFIVLNVLVIFFVPKFEPIVYEDDDEPEVEDDYDDEEEEREDRGDRGDREDREDRGKRRRKRRRRGGRDREDEAPGGEQDAGSEDETDEEADAREEREDREDRRIPSRARTDQADQSAVRPADPFRRDRRCGPEELQRSCA